MSSLITNATIQIRKDTAGNWTSNNPTPAAGEWCYETDTGSLKIGDGSTAWISLKYKIWPLSRSRATRTTAQSFPDSTPTIIIYNTKVFDNLGEYDETTGVFTATNAGYYQVNASLLSDSAAWAVNEFWVIELFKNGVLYSRGVYRQADAIVTANFGSTFSDMVFLNATDYIDMRIRHNQGAPVNNITTAVYNYFSVHRLS